MMLKAAVGGRVARLLRTGPTPGACHGASVSGMSDVALRQVRAIAGELVGVRPGASLTAYLFLQPDPFFDPIVSCSVAPIRCYAGWIWDGQGSLARLQRAWSAMEPRISKGATWAMSRGPPVGDMAQPP